MSTQENINELTCSLGAVSLKNDEELKDEKPSSFKTGLIYDERMTAYKCTTVHPERPERITRIFEKLLEKKLVERCKRIKPRFANKEEILLKHTKEHFDMISNVVEKTAEELEMMSHSYDSIYFHTNISQSALLSAGCTLELVEQVLQGKITNGAAVVRPPGHHALEDKPMGFCHYNNVAIAAMMAVEKYKLSRVVIVDWDVHYGNATHQMFNDDPRVFYFSLHRYDNCLFWPNLVEANYDAVGKGPGEGYNMHVAWNRGKVKDSSYLFAFDNVLVPILKDFDPQLVLVSAGFDSGINDPLGGCCVSPLGYAQMTKKLMQFAQGKVVVVLEGGYNLKTISNSMAMCVATLLGDQLPLFEPTEDEKPHQKSLKSICNTFFTHLPYWKKALTPYEEMFENLKKSLEEKEKNTKMILDSSSSSSSSEDDSPDLLKNQGSTTWTFTGTLDE